VEKGVSRFGGGGDGGGCSPVGVIFDELSGKRRLRSIFLVSDFEAADFADCVGLKGEVVFILRSCVGILYDNVDGLPDVALLEVDVPQQIDISPDLLGFEGVWENLMRG